MDRLTLEDALDLADALLALQRQMNGLVEAQANTLEAVAKLSTRLRAAEGHVRVLQGTDTHRGERRSLRLSAYEGGAE